MCNGGRGETTIHDAYSLSLPPPTEDMLSPWARGGESYKQLAIKGHYTFARVVVLVVSMAVPDLAVAPRRGGKCAVRAGILGIRVIVIEREWEIKKISPLLLFASPQLTCWLSIYLRCRFAGYGFPRDSYAIANPRAFIPRSNSLFQPSYLLVLLRLPPSYSLT